MSETRSFSIEQKMQIRREVDASGMIATLRKYEISDSLFTGARISLIAEGTWIRF